MRTSAFVIAALVALTGAAAADPWKDESGKGRWRGEYRDDYRGGYGGGYREHYAREGKQEFYRDGCKVERKWERNGGYKEEIKCDETYGSAPREDFVQRGQWRRDSRQWRRDISPADLVPPTWQLQPSDPNWTGKRFLSPDGASWLAVYAFPTAKEPIATHMQSVAFAEGETLTYLRGERDWIVVSGTKGDRIFYRKATIACGGKVWHHIAFEYPVERKRAMDPFVIRAATIIDLAENDGCEEATSSVDAERR